MSDELKARVREQFSDIAADYLHSPLFSQGDDLQYVVEAAGLTGEEKALDVACGAGHTTIALARAGGTCIGMDLTVEMVATAERYAKEIGVNNVTFEVGDAERLPWPDETFDVVTCRYAVHHFANPDQFIEEASRVLRPGGVLLIVDHYAAEDDALDEYVNHLNRKRDKSHVREPRLSEYRVWFATSKLAYEEVLQWDLELGFEDWVARSRTPSHVREELVAMLTNPPQGAKERLHITLDEDNAKPVSFSLTCALLRGTKPLSRS